MKISFGFRLSVIICVVALFVAAGNFISVRVRADKAGNAAKAAEAAVAKAEDLAQRCRELKGVADQANFELDEANRRVKEAAGTSEEGARQKEQKKALKKAYDATSAANSKCGDARDAREAADAAIKQAEEALKEKTDRGGKDDDGVGKKQEDLKKRAQALKPKEAQGNIAPTGGQAPVVTESQNGIRVANFETSSGRIRVNLPDDMMAGDMISGTVIAEPKGQTQDERAANTRKLTDYAVDFIWSKSSPQTGKTSVPLASDSYKKGETLGPDDVRRILESLEHGRAFTVTLPKSDKNAPSEQSLEIDLIERIDNLPSNGPKITSTTVPILPTLETHVTTPLTHRQFDFPTIGQLGRPVEIIGPFDGNAANTRLMYAPIGSSIQDFEKNTENVSGGFGLIRPLAESPRKLVFQGPDSLTGPVRIMVKEGNRADTGAYRNVGVRLTAPKTNLLKGERTNLTIEVSGLQGITKPVPLTLEAKGVINMEGGMFQPLVIQPSQVAADGRYTTNREITALQTGAWQATATVVTLPPLILLRDPSPPRQLVMNTRTGHYDFCGAGEKFSGNAQVKADGCTFYFFEPSNEEVVIGALNACNFNNRYWVFAGGLPSLNVDLRVKLDRFSPSGKKVYFNPLGKPAPPVQDVSAFATCP